MDIFTSKHARIGGKLTGAVIEVPADEADNAPAEYYTIEGIRVANPGHGLYIVRKGNKVSKVIL